jgi:hypothetical protein
MAVESIRTTIEVGNVAGDHLLVSASEMALRKMDRVSEFKHTAEEVGARSEALYDAGDLLSSRARAPVVVSSERIAGGFGIFDDLDFCRRFCRLRDRKLCPVIFVIVVCHD